MFGGEVELLMQRIAERESQLFPPVDGTFDTEPPTIAVEAVDPDDLQPTAIVEGSIAFRVTVRDAVKMPNDDGGGVAPVRFVRAADEKVEGQASGPVVSRSEPDPRTRVLEVSFDTTAFADGPVKLRIDAADAAGNTAILDWTLHINNDPNGTVAGTVTAGGRVAGAEVTVYDVTGGTVGAELGSAVTDEDGFFLVSLVESPSTTALLLQARKPAAGDATYIEAASGVTIAFSTDDVLESVIADYVEGQNRSVQVTPLTHVATAFARGLHGTKFFGVPDLFDDAVADAFALLESHFADGGPTILLRTVRPSDITVASEVTTLNAQARYGVVLAGVAQLADIHAQESFMSPSVMNTMTLTRRLAQDLADDAFGEPLWDGGNTAGPLLHGLVAGTSYWTRVDLAVAIVSFVETNPQDASGFTESDLLSLLDFVSLDDNPRLYPLGDEPIAYDLIPPGPVVFDSPPTPADGTVLRGTITLQVRASDNRKLTALTWVTPGVTGVLLDSSAGPEGPWVLSGNLATDCAAEGPLVLQARATDEANNATDATRTVIVDCTPPDVVILAAEADDAPLVDGGWTGAASITITGRVTDANGVASSSYTWRGGPSTPLTLGADGNWSLSLPLSEGANTLVVAAVDHAGNAAAPAQATYNRDATPPEIVAVTGTSAATMVDEVNFTVATTATAVTYTPPPLPLTKKVEAGLTYTKYATRYLDPSVPGVTNLPEWRFQVTDDHAAAGEITFEVLIRHGSTVVLGWTPVVYDDHAGAYNRALTVHGGLAPYIAEHSGTYTMEYRATDTFGNSSSVASLQWTQSLRAPPLHLIGGSATEHLQHDLNRVPAGYSLTANNFSTLINGPPTGQLRVAVWQVSNPNPVPVHFRPHATVVDATWSVERQHQVEKTAELSNILKGCDDDGLFDQTLTGTACYTAGADNAFTTDASNHIAQLYNGNIEVYQLTSGGWVLLPTCTGCEANERELPPNSNVVMFAQSDRWDFLQFGGTVSEIGSVGSISNITGRLGGTFRRCTGVSMLKCVDQDQFRELDMYTRVLVTFSSTATKSRVQSRLSTSGEGFTSFALSSAPGTDSTGGTTLKYETAETGYPAYDSHGDF